jgi:hypothetical protein
LKIVIFSPYAYIKEWRLTDLYLANSFSSQKDKIIFLECNGYQRVCTCMLAAGLDWESGDKSRNEICKACKNFALITRNLFSLQTKKLDDYLNETDHVLASKIIEKNKSSEICLNGVNVSNACLYSLLIEYQFTSFHQIKKFKLKSYFAELNTGIKTVLAAEKFFTENKPDILLLHNGLYATGNILSQVANNHNCIVYTHINGSNRQRFDQSIRIAKGNFYDQNEKLQSFFSLKNKLLKKDANTITAHLNTLQKGRAKIKFSTSKKNKIPIWLNKLIKGKKVILLALSSNDELVGAQILGYKSKKGNLFKDQLDWILKTIKILKRNSKIFLIIRPHPREFPNPRTRSITPTKHILSLIHSLQNNVPRNTIINLPEHNISIYDLLTISHVVINGWSSVGEEAGILGKNVLTAFPKYANYPYGLTPSYESLRNYKTQVQRLLRAPLKNKTNTVAFCKWRAFSVNKCEELSPNFSKILKKVYEHNNFIEKIFMKICKRFFVRYKIKKLLRSYKSKSIQQLVVKKRNFLFENFQADKEKNYRKNTQKKCLKNSEI